MRTSSSQLKAHMGKYMRAVRAGEEVVVTDRGEPVAKLAPFKEPVAADAAEGPAAASSDPAAPPLGRVEVRPIRYRGRSTTALLSEDRRRRR